MRALGSQQQVRTPAVTMVPANSQFMRKWARSCGATHGRGARRVASDLLLPSAETNQS